MPGQLGESMDFHLPLVYDWSREILGGSFGEIESDLSSEDSSRALRLQVGTTLCGNLGEHFVRSLRVGCWKTFEGRRLTGRLKFTLDSGGFMYFPIVRISGSDGTLTKELPVGGPLFAKALHETLTEEGTIRVNKPLCDFRVDFF